MTDERFMNLYWKQFLMIEKEFRKSLQFISLAVDNLDSYSDFYAKILLQIGSEIDVVAKILCKEINAGNVAENIKDYSKELLQAFPELEYVSVQCNDITVIPWKDWSVSTPTWWLVYNGVKHNRGMIKTYEGITKENYKFASMKNIVSSLAGLYLLELYLYNQVIDANPHTDTPIPGSRLFKAIDYGWECKSTYADTAYVIDTESGHLMYVQPHYIYSDL